MDTEERRGGRGLAVACSLPPEQERERREELTQQLLAGSTAITKIEDGFEYAFSGDAVWAEEIVRFIIEERECCRFLTFEITFEPDQGPIRLRITGPEGTREFLAPQHDATPGSTLASPQ